MGFAWALTVSYCNFETLGKVWASETGPGSVKLTASVSVRTCPLRPAGSFRKAGLGLIGVLLLRASAYRTVSRFANIYRGRHTGAVASCR
jgi:hypothetical protein